MGINVKTSLPQASVQVPTTISTSLHLITKYLMSIGGIGTVTLRRQGVCLVQALPPQVLHVALPRWAVIHCLLNLNLIAICFIYFSSHHLSGFL